MRSFGSARAVDGHCAAHCATQRARASTTQETFMHDACTSQPTSNALPARPNTKPSTTKSDGQIFPSPDARRRFAAPACSCSSSASRGILCAAENAAKFGEKTQTLHIVAISAGSEAPHECDGCAFNARTWRCLSNVTSAKKASENACAFTAARASRSQSTMFVLTIFLRWFHHTHTCTRAC